MNKEKNITENQRIIDSYDYLADSASSNDCTGLIPSAPQNSAELEAYQDVYAYMPPKLSKPKRASKQDL